MTLNLALNKQHLVIEGPIGVGKSSLCRKLVEHCGGELFLEKPSENLFLERFYKNAKHYALPTQLSFLIQRVQQDAELKAKQKNRGFGNIVADFMIEKDPIFAKLTLADDELRLYRQIYAGLRVEATQPDLVVYLQAPVDVLKQRIKKRDIKFELKIEKSYLERLSDAYTEYFHDYTNAPLLIVNAGLFNPIDNDEHFEALLEQINRVQAGKHFFNPMQ